LPRRAAAGRPAIRDPRHPPFGGLCADSATAAWRDAAARPRSGAASGQVANVSRLAGSALGGILAAFGGIIAVTLVDAAMLVWLKEESGEPASASAQRQGEPALVTAEG
jgi:hypothetical protein